MSNGFPSFPFIHLVLPSLSHTLSSSRWTASHLKNRRRSSPKGSVRQIMYGREKGGVRKGERRWEKEKEARERCNAAHRETEESMAVA